MPDTNYNVRFEQSSGDVSVVVLRNSTTSPVDSTAGSAGNRILIPKLMDNGGGNIWSVISAATAATPIVATAAAGHGIVTGDLVLIKGGTGDPNINGTFLVTVSTNDLTLVGSATDGTYTASSASVIKLRKAKSYHIALAAAMAAILNDKAAGN